jgi:hypothetical protein
MIYSLCLIEDIALPAHTSPNFAEAQNSKNREYSHDLPPIRRNKIDQKQQLLVLWYTVSICHHQYIYIHGNQKERRSKANKSNDDLGETRGLKSVGSITNMAAKQGTLAQLSAQAEDAKRAVLSKAGATSWFSNLNTVCTVKSAPPRTPEVLQLLATKAGWLYKRNEQHVWQARWCCVVPHTFLYYFDAPAGASVPNMGGAGMFQNSCPGPAQQEEWNHAVLYGLGDRKPHEKRSHFPLFHGSTSTNATADVNASSTSALNVNDDYDVGVAPPNSQNLPPAGIIDLECYSTIHRSSENEAILQLAGDDQVNPDLRAFYFCCETAQEVEEWSSAILNDRHSALQDEVEAFKYVADSFAERLDLLYADLNEAKTQQEESEQVLYRVRSAAEETCRTVYRIAENCLERAIPASSVSTVVNIDTLNLHEKRLEFRRNHETVRQQDMGVNASVRLLADYITVVEDMCAALDCSVKKLQSDVQKSDLTDQAEILVLQEASEIAKKQHMAEKEQFLQELAAAQAASQAATKELQDVQENLSSTKMEVTMLLSEQRNKLATQLQHKKILKKEVIDLRQKVEDVASEHSTLHHEYEKMKLQLEQERSKNALLSRYMSKMESQVQVQQNMMEMMSQTGGSVYGGVGGMSVTLHPTSGNRSVVSRNRRTERRSVADGAEDDDDDDDFNNDENCMDEHDVIEEDFENDERMLLQPPNIPASPALRGSGRRRRIPHTMSSYNMHRRASSFMSDNDVDNKSHLSELTEDRTQREFATFQGNQHQLQQSIRQQSFSPKGDYFGEHQSTSDNFQLAARTRKLMQEQAVTKSPRTITSGPPSVIIGVKKTDANSAVKGGDNYQRSNPSNRTLDTINNGGGSVRSLPLSGVNVSTPPLYKIRDDKASDNDNGRRDNISVSSGEHTMESESKLSVAQRARLAADTKNTPVRVRLDEKSLSSLQRKSSDSNLEALANMGVVPNSSSSTPSRINTARPRGSGNNQQMKPSSPQHSQGSGLWRRVEEAVLGTRSDDDESYTSEGSTRVTDTTDEGNHAREKAKRRFVSRDVRDMDEKKSSDSVVSFSVSVVLQCWQDHFPFLHAHFVQMDLPFSLQNLSLQERSQIQRDKQLRFLRDQGLIKRASDVKGGAGALDSASVTSSNVATSTTSSILKRVALPPKNNL